MGRSTRRLHLMHCIWSRARIITITLYALQSRNSHIVVGFFRGRRAVHTKTNTAHKPTALYIPRLIYLKARLCVYIPFIFKFLEIYCTCADARLCVGSGCEVNTHTNTHARANSPLCCGQLTAAHHLSSLSVVQLAAGAAAVLSVCVCPDPAALPACIANVRVPLYRVWLRSRHTDTTGGMAQTSANESRNAPHTVWLDVFDAHCGRVVIEICRLAQRGGRKMKCLCSKCARYTNCMCNYRTIYSV